MINKMNIPMIFVINNNLNTYDIIDFVRNKQIEYNTE